MKLSPTIRSTLLTLLCILSLGCMADDSAPTDIVIEGPFTFDKEWQIIQFKKPLKVLPQLHELKFLLARGKYDRPGLRERSQYRINGYGFAIPDGGPVIEPQVILITKDGRRFETVQVSSGYWKVEQGVFDFVSVATNSRAGKFYFPKGTEFVAAKIKSNVKLEVEHLYWFAYSWMKNPYARWGDIEPSKIVELD